MKRIHDPALLQHYLKNQEILHHFGCEPLSFQLIRYEKGEFLTDPDRPLKGLLFIMEGSVRIYNIREDGSQFVVDWAKPPTILGDLEFCLSRIDSMYSEAIEPVMCVYLPFDKHKTQLENDPVFLRFMLKHLAKSVINTAQMEYSSPTLEAKVLFDLRHRQPHHTLSGVSEAIDHLHCSRRQLQRVLRDLCDRGILQKVKKGTYRLLE